MSVVAPHLPPVPRSTPVRALPAHEPAARPPRFIPPFPARRARRGSPTAFWILTTLVVTLLIVAIASLSAVLVRESFHVDELRQTMTTLRAANEQLSTNVVTLSAPSRIAAWARDVGMVRADRVAVLRVPTRPPA